MAHAINECDCCYMTTGEHVKTCPAYERDRDEPCSCTYMCDGKHSLDCSQYGVD